MPPKKRKAAEVENENVLIGRKKIRKTAEGKKLSDEAIRNNVLLFLEKLKDDEANDPAGDAFQAKLSSAVAGALDPVVGPEALMHLSTYGFEGQTVFGNKEAGELLRPIMNLADDGGAKRIRELQADLADDGGAKRIGELQADLDKQKGQLDSQKGQLDSQKVQLDKKKERIEKVEKTLAYLQQLIPINPAGQKGLADDLEALDRPVQDAAWLYELLWTSCLLWMDTRLRQLRMYTRMEQTTKSTLEPGSAIARAEMINSRIHGGNLRVDAVIGAIDFGYYRHNNASYDTYFRDCFRKMYNLSLAEGLWLARYGNDIYRKVDWPQVVGFIDKFVAMADRIHSWNQKRPSNYKDVVDLHFKPLTVYVSGLIAQAEADPDWEIDAQSAATLQGLQNNVYKNCTGPTWIAKKDNMCLWDKMGNVQVQNPWPPAAYLNDTATSRQRTAGQGAAVMTLRPQPRIKYTA